jgi:hypothetical protein
MAASQNDGRRRFNALPEIRVEYDPERRSTTRGGPDVAEVRIKLAMMHPPSESRPSTPKVSPCVTNGAPAPAVVMTSSRMCGSVVTSVKSNINLPSGVRNARGADDYQ